MFSTPASDNNQTEREAGRVKANEKQRLRLWLQLAKTVLPLSRVIDGRFRQRFGQSLVRFDVMSQLARHVDGLQTGQLADRMLAATSGNITMLLHRMVSEGLIERRASPQDGRVSLIFLTDAGRDLFSDMAVAQEAWINETFEDLDEAQVRQLADDLAAMAEETKRPQSAH